MKLPAFLALAAAVLTVAGCSPQQQADANSAGRRAQRDLGKATAGAQKALSDGSVTLKVKAALGASDQVNTSAVHVATRSGVVTLTGAVANAHQKALAGQIAKDTVGAGIRVVNQLQVQPPGKG